MRRPQSLMPHRVRVEAYLGTTGQAGPKFAPAQRRHAEVIGKRRTVTTADGRTVVGSAVVKVVGAEVPLHSRITHGDDTYTVLEALAHCGPGGQVVERELIVGRA